MATPTANGCKRMNTTQVRNRLRDQLGIPWRGAFAHPTLVMGIVNVTPDSFQLEGRHPEAETAIAHVKRLVDEGADIVDIGGESTRPGAETVAPDVEIHRVVPVIREAALLGVPVSVDTRKSEVALAAVQAGARIINDVSAGRFDPDLLRVAAETGAFLCLMHAPVDIGAMGWSTGLNPVYADVVAEVRDFLLERVETAISAGVNPERIWIDPGFGFGKTVEDNLHLLRELEAFVETGHPVLVGVSRKSTLGRILDGAGPETRVEAGLAALALAIRSGVSVVRVHDVAASVRAARMADAIIHTPA